MRARLILLAGVSVFALGGCGVILGIPDETLGDPFADAGLDGTAAGVDGGGVDAGHPGDAATDGARGPDGGPPVDGALPPDAGVDAGPPVGTSVLQFHNHINRDGLFIDPAITKTTAATFHLDQTFQATITGNVYASPLYVQNGPAGSAFYIATESNDVYAIAETTGAVVWHQNVGTAASQSGASCGNISPIGVTGTPAIDLASGLIVFDAATADAAGSIKTHTIHALSLKDGTSKWSVDVSTLKDPTGLAFSPQPQNQRAAVLIVGGIAYVAFGGHAGDCGSYHGWVVGVPLATPANAKAWATQVGGAGIWGPGGPASDGQSIYVTTGNGIGGNSTWQESEGVFRLDPGPTFTQQAADYFAPTNFASLDSADLDISGSGPLVMDVPGFNPSTLVMGQGKDGNLYLLNRLSLGGVSSANIGMLHVQSGEISQAGAWATAGGTTYVVVRPNGSNLGAGCPNGTSGDLVAVKLDPTAASKMAMAWCAVSNGGGSPIITTSDGNANGLVWAMAAEGSNKLYAWDLATGAVVFNGGTAADAVSGTVHHFSTVLAANGRIIVSADGALYAYTH